MIQTLHTYLRIGFRLWELLFLWTGYVPKRLRRPLSAKYANGDYDGQKEESHSGLYCGQCGMAYFECPCQKR